MNSLVFSEHESADSIWSPPSDDCYWFNSIQTNLTRTNSELRFEKFMEEFSASISAAEQVYNPPVIDTGSDSPEEWEEAVKFADGCLVSDPDEDMVTDESNSDVNSMLLSKELVLRPLDLPPLPPLDSDSLRGYLINELERACASVAQRWQRSEPSTTNGSGRDFPMAQSEVYGAPPEIPALPPLQRRARAQVKQAACGSSRDEARHIRRPRMMANRESAGCSIIRKEEEMKQIETQVGVLKAAYSKLSENLSEMKKKCGTSYYELKVLSDENEIRKTQISMHELQIMRLTGLHPLNNPEFLALVNSPTHASKNAARPIPSRHQFFHQPLSQYLQLPMVLHNCIQQPPIPIFGNQQNDIGVSKAAKMCLM